LTGLVLSVLTLVEAVYSGLQGLRTGRLGDRLKSP